MIFCSTQALLFFSQHKIAAYYPELRLPTLRTHRSVEGKTAKRSRRNTRTSRNRFSGRIENIVYFTAMSRFL